MALAETQSSLAHGMDREGFLLPSSRAAVKLRLEEAAPLLARDYELASQLDRFLDLSGIGRGEGFAQLLAESRQIFEELEERLIRFVPAVETGVEDLLFKAKIHSLCEFLHCYDLTYFMARNGELSADQYLRTSNYLRSLSESIHSSCASLSEMVPTTDSSQYFLDLVQELSYLPEQVAGRRCLRFDLREDIPLQSGDVFGLPGLGRLIVLSKDERGLLRCISYSQQSHRYESLSVSENDVYVAAPTVSRGGENDLYFGREPFSPMQPFGEKVHVEPSPLWSGGEGYAFGEILQYDQVTEKLSVLWHLKDGSARVEEATESEVRVRAEFPFGTGGARSVFAESSFEELATLGGLNDTREAQRDYEGRELQALCNAVLKAELPIALHIVGSEWACSRFEEVNLLSKQMVQVTTGELPKWDPNHPNHLRAHMCTPVLLVLDSVGDRALTTRLLRLKQLGWEVVVAQGLNELSEDHFIKWAIEDNDLRDESEQFRVIDATDKSIARTLRALGARSAGELTREIPCRDGGSETRAKISRTLASRLSCALDHIAEASPTRPITRRPVDLRALKSIVDHPEDFESAPVDSQVYALAHSPGDLHGRSDIPSSISRRELVELSGALAKSRLSPSHPAVILRGITCLDLSPKALEALLDQGAHVIRVADNAGATRGVVISLPPAVTDATRPGLSVALGREGEVGYVYWIWLDPTLTNEVRAPYAKLVNGLVFDQLQDGASFIFGRVLERNTPSVRSARGISGFDLLPIKIEIAGERAVGLGLDLNKWDELVIPEAIEQNARSIMADAVDLFTRGLPHAVLNENDLEHLRTRVAVASDFITQQFEFRCCCQDLLAVARPEVAWGVISQAATRLEESLEALKPWLTHAQVSDLEDTISLMTDDDLREVALKRFQELLLEVAPEPPKELARLHEILTKKALEHLGLPLKALPLHIPAQPNRVRAEAIPLPPRINFSVVPERYQALSEEVKRLLSRWMEYRWEKLSVVRDDHPNIIRIRRGRRDWVESELDGGGAYLWPVDDTGEVFGHQISQIEHEHLTEFNAIIEWANQVARAGHYDYSFGARVWTMLRPFIKATAT